MCAVNKKNITIDASFEMPKTELNDLFFGENDGLYQFYKKMHLKMEVDRKLIYPYENIISKMIRIR